MKLRYYLRGLGTGIVVTALILSRLTGAARPLTDAEIRAKALTLGMVDADSLSLADVAGGGSSQESVNAETEVNSPEPKETSGSENSDPSETPDGEEGSEPTDTSEPRESEMPENPEDADSSDSTESSTPEPTPASSPSPSPDPVVTDSPTSEPAETVTIVISGGDSSYTVSRKLVEAGLVEDAREFDAYLVDNGYSRTIRTGTYRIPVDASWEEIADIIA